MSRELPAARMETCSKCQRETRHEPNDVGDLKCVICKRRDSNRFTGTMLIAIFIALGIGAAFYIAMRDDARGKLRGDRDRGAVNVVT